MCQKVISNLEKYLTLSLSEQGFPSHMHVSSKHSIRVFHYALLIAEAHGMLLDWE